jgi:hypothetical protein
MPDDKGADWTRENLIAELRYLASAITYDWDEDLADSLAKVTETFGLLPEYEEPDTTNYQETAFREA